MMIETPLNMAYYSANDDITFTPLPHAEEIRLFKIFLKAPKNSKAGLAARDTLITHHLKLVVKHSIAWAKQAIPDDIAISAGNAALLQALECRRFDPDRGIRFATFLRLFIRGQVFKAIRAHHSPRELAPEPEHYLPTPNLEATLTGQPARNHCIVADKPLWGDAPTSDPDCYEQALAADREKVVAKALSRLHGLEAISVRRKQLEGATFEEIAQEQGVSRQACAQAHNRGLTKLRKLLVSQRSELL